MAGAGTDGRESSQPDVVTRAHHGSIDPAGAAVRALTAVGSQARMRTAIDAGELALHYQPIVDLGTGQPTGVEALLRWHHPSRGLLTPDEFLPAVEQTPVIIDLTRWVLRTACAAAVRWPNWTVAANISARDLVGTTLLDSVTDALEETGVPAHRLALEVTETAVVQDLEHAARTLGAIREQGVAVALDDFGTGYSSMLYLRELPVTGVKIDREFVSGLDDGGDDKAIVSSLLTLADATGVTAVAEGVETAEQAEMLVTLGCCLAQGYRWSRPQPPDAIDVIYRDGLRQPIARRLRRPRPGSPPPGDQRVFELAATMLRQGASLHTIAAALNTAGERTSQGHRWHAATVARLISGSPEAGSPRPTGAE